MMTTSDALAGNFRLADLLDTEALLALGWCLRVDRRLAVTLLDLVGGVEAAMAVTIARPTPWREGELHAAIRGWLAAVNLVSAAYCDETSAVEASA